MAKKKNLFKKIDQIVVLWHYITLILDVERHCVVCTDWVSDATSMFEPDAILSILSWKIRRNTFGTSGF